MAHFRPIATPVLLLACWLVVPPCGYTQITDSEKSGTTDGAAIGAIAGAFISAYPALIEGAGGGAGGNSLGWVGAGTLLGGLIGGRSRLFSGAQMACVIRKHPKVCGLQSGESVRGAVPSAGWKSMGLHWHLCRRQALMSYPARPLLPSWYS